MLVGSMGLFFLLIFACLLVCVLASSAVVWQLRRPPRKTFGVAVGAGELTDPADLGLEAREMQFRLADGSQSPGWIIAGDQPRGPTVVIVHGFGDSRYGALTWTPLFIPLASRVVLFDLPGQGESQAADSGGGLREPADVLAVVDQLGEQGNVVLMGYSMGAGIAIAAGAQADAHVVGVIADGPYQRWDEPLVEIFKANRYPRWPVLPMAGLWLRLTAKGFADFDRVAWARKLRVPLLVLHGSDDELCPLASARAIAEAAQQGKLVEFPGGGHLNLAVTDETRYRQALETFFTSLQQNLHSQQGR